MATDRELAAQSMMQAGIGSLGGRPYTTYRDKMNQAITNLQATQMGDWEGRRTSDDIRKDAIKWGRKAGLPNRISFAGEGGRDILNPNEMRVNAPSYGDWKSMAKRKMIMDRRYQGEDNPYYEIPATNQGYKVWNASGPMNLWHYLKRFAPGYDKEQDEKRYKPYIDPEIEQDKLEADEQRRADWFAEYGTEGTGEYYPDKILRDAFPQSYPYLADWFTDLMEPDLMDKEPDDKMVPGSTGPYTLEAKVNLQDVQERIGGDINWNKFLRDLESRGIAYGRRGGIMGLV